MANYQCAVRTNYFHVKDEAAFKKLMANVVCSEDYVEVWEREDENGNKVFGFGCCSSINGLPTQMECEGYEYSYDDFIDKLQSLVAYDDAIIIFEVGREKLKFLTGLATIITSSICKNVDIADFAIENAKHMLKNPGWVTTYSY